MCKPRELRHAPLHGVNANIIHGHSRSSRQCNRHEPDGHLHILHLEDSEVDHAARPARAASKTCGPFSNRSGSTRWQGFQEQAQTGQFDVIVADYRLPGFTRTGCVAAGQGLGHTVRPSSCYRAPSESPRRCRRSSWASATTCPRMDVRNRAPRHAIRRDCGYRGQSSTSADPLGSWRSPEQRLAQFAEHLQDDHRAGTRGHRTRNSR